MNLLGIDTSTDLAFVALHTAGQFYTREKMGMRSHAQDLLPMIEAVLQKAAIRLDQLDGIVFGQGPGGFTGLRVACSIAKGLSYSLNLPLFPVCTLSAIIWAVRQTQPEMPVLAIMDARMNQLYWMYDSHARISAVEVSDPECIHMPFDADYTLAGIGWTHYEDKLNTTLKIQPVSKYEIYPKASLMIEMVLHGIINPVSAEKARPLYVRNRVVNT